MNVLGGNQVHLWTYHKFQSFGEGFDGKIPISGQPLKDYFGCVGRQHMLCYFGIGQGVVLWELSDRLSFCFHVTIAKS